MKWPFGKSRNREIDEEVESHLRMAIRDRIERGESPQEARRSALLELGNVTLLKEDTRAIWNWTGLEHLLLDVRSAARVLTKAPAFSAAAILLIALGIGGNATIFSMIRGVLTKPAPGIEAEGLATMGRTVDGELKFGIAENSFPNYLDYSAQAETVRNLMAFTFERFSMRTQTGTYRLRGQLVTRNYFEALGVDLAKGREFTEDEERGAAPLAAIITHHVWENQFQSANDVIGKSIVLNGHPATIVGVAPAGFRGTQFAPNFEICVPVVAYSRLRGTADALQDRAAASVVMMGRLAPGTTLTEAQAEFAAISKRLEAAYPEANRGQSVMVWPYSATAFGPLQGTQARMFMAILLAVSLLTLLVVCANVANLILARAVRRQREMALRQSLGASRLRLLRMLLAEGLVLSLTACMASILFAWWITDAVGKLLPPIESGARFVIDLKPDWAVAAYAMSLAVFSTLAFTLAPALRTWRQQLLPWLKAGEHGVVQGRSRLANFLVATQLALCVLLLISAGLGQRSVGLIETTDLHFDRNNLLLADVDTDEAAGGGQGIVLMERLRERLQAIPGVAAVSYAVSAPPRARSGMRIRALGSAEEDRTDLNSVGPAYLAALGVPVIAGRDISAADLASAGAAAVINQKLAQTLWPGQSALDQTMLLGADERPVKVAGVVPNGAFSGIGEGGSLAGIGSGERGNFVFLSEQLSQGGRGDRTLHVRYTGDVGAVTRAVRAAIQDVDDRLPVFSVRTMETEWASFTAPVRIITMLLGLFSTAALALATVGLYAVVAFQATRRTRDFGVRMALGASSRQILKGVLREGLRTSAIGVTAGLILSGAATRGLGSLLFGVSPTDGLTYSGVIGLMAAVSLVACYLPARRAARVNPVHALRQE